MKSPYALRTLGFKIFLGKKEEDFEISQRIENECELGIGNRLEQHGVKGSEKIHKRTELMSPRCSL